MRGHLRRCVGGRRCRGEGGDRLMRGHLRRCVGGRCGGEEGGQDHEVLSTDVWEGRCVWGGQAHNCVRVPSRFVRRSTSLGMPTLGTGLYTS